MIIKKTIAINETYPIKQKPVYIMVWKLDPSFDFRTSELATYMVVNKLECLGFSHYKVS